jgi:hypothetical protein
MIASHSSLDDLDPAYRAFGVIDGGGESIPDAGIPPA